ncbi:MAG: glycosyltransferase family 4 protein [Deltaproteobacteria bacterium]|nr:glycosyltransferase family 4 protein [Deltaproteobacteria bacterium]
MQIILLSTTTGDHGGIRQAWYLARALRDAGYGVDFVCYADSWFAHTYPDSGWTALPEGKLGALPSIERTLRSLMPPGKNVIVHAFHNWGVKLASYLGTFWRLRGLPVACVAHRGVTRRPGNPLPYLLPGLRAYLVNSPECAAQLPLLWRRRRCLVVSNSIPPERLLCTRTPEETRAELAISPRHFVFGDVAHDKPEKGVERLLRAYALVAPREPLSTLVVVGVDPARWLPLAEKLGLAGKVRFVPRTENVANYMQIFSLFVFPSYFIESQPNVVMEAMSLGKPVIGGDLGQVKNMLGSAYVFPPGEVEGMAAMMLKAARDLEFTRAGAAANLERSRDFSTATRLRKVLGVYRAVLAESGFTEQE